MNKQAYILGYKQAGILDDMGRANNNRQATAQYNADSQKLDEQAAIMIPTAAREGGNLGLPVGAGIGGLTGYGASSIYGSLTDNKSRIRDILVAGSGMLIGGGVGRSGGRAVGAIAGKNMLDDERRNLKNNYEDSLI